MKNEKISKKLEKINQKIQNENAAFKKASKAEKRVMIANDVLAQIKAKRFIASPGTWVSTNYVGDAYTEDDRCNLSGDESVQQLFATKTLSTCEVCALGGLFMSCTNLNNNTTVEQLSHEKYNIGDIISDGDKLSNGLDKFFTKNQLMLIEIYFENADGYFSQLGEVKADLDHVENFYSSYEDDNDRLKAIMKNIVENNGTFVPKKLKI